ncbi:MAG: hypothetical protein ACXW19_09830 [Thermoanaerobaculia bacterium]
MQNKKKLSLKIAGTLALATLVGTSAFAEGRHQQRTERGPGGRIERGNISRSNGSFEHRGNTSRNNSQRSFQRSEARGNDRRFESRQRSERGNIQRDDARLRESQRSDSRGRNDGRINRNDGRNDRFSNNRGSWQPNSRVAPSRGQRFDGHGRVQRFVRERNGYRVWIGGGYPIFVPFSYWRLHPLRIGLNIRFGGYWDPLGYWSVYDYSPYDGYGYGSRYNDVYTSGEIRGVVESVDFRRGTLVINDDISRQFVTVTLPRDRRVESIRPGDYVDFSGDWTRRGVFNAYRLERLEEGRY